MNRLSEFGPIAALIKLWRDLTPSQRVVVIAFVLVALIAVSVVGSRLTKTRMGILFSNLEPADAQAIVAKLDESKTPYELTGNGTTIEVPEDMVPQARMKMAADGLPQGGTIGFEAFDKGSQFTTEFADKIKLTRAIQGELTRTICSLSPVMNARVMIVQPEKALFESEQDPTTASVFLKLRRGTPLGDEQISGIVRLVSSAVQSLKPDNVTVVDSDGNILSAGNESSGYGGMGTNNQAKFKSQVEIETAKSIQTMLAKVVGNDKVVVRVNAAVSFDQTKTEQQDYEPAVGAGPKGVLESQETHEETYNGAVLPPGGIAPGRANGTPGPNDKYEKRENTSQYRVNVKKTETVSAPGKIDRLSVSVLLDDKILEGQVPAIKAAVTAAAGIDTKRGDIIEVIRQPFDKSQQTAMDKEFKTESQKDLYMNIAKNGGAALLLIMFMLFLRSIVKQIKVQYPAAPEQAPEPSFEGSLFPGDGLPTPEQLIGAPSGQVFDTSENTHEDTYSTMPPRDRLPAEVVNSSPEDLAKLVRGWMSDER